MGRPAYAVGLARHGRRHRGPGRRRRWSVPRRLPGPLRPGRSGPGRAGRRRLAVRPTHHLDTEGALSRLFHAPGLAGEVTSASRRAVRASGGTPAAAQRSTSGAPLLAYDAGLSPLLARTTAGDEGVLSTQQFVAESAALLNELPGTQGRSVFVVAPRTYDPDPTAARTFFAATASIPWLTTTTTDAELSRPARGTHRGCAGHRRRSPVRRTCGPHLGGVAGWSGRWTPCTGSAGPRGRRHLRADLGPRHRAARLHPVAQRPARLEHGQPRDPGSHARPRRPSRSGSTINFLADTGRLQITITNDLDVPVRNIKVTVDASNPRLRIDSQPPVLRIGAGSRATVTWGDGPRRGTCPFEPRYHPRRDRHRPRCGRRGPGHPGREAGLAYWSPSYRADRPARGAAARDHPVLRPAARPGPTGRRPTREASPARPET